MHKYKRHRLLVSSILVPTAILSGWLFMNTHWFTAVLLLAIAVLPILRRHRRRCEACGSWRTHIEIHERAVEANPAVIILATVRRCLACYAGSVLGAIHVPNLRIQS